MSKINNMYKKIKKQIGEFKPEIALILGSGLSDACPDMKIFKEIDYETVGLPKSTVKGHIDKFIFGEFKNIKIVKLSRFHYYESGDLNKLSLPFEIISKLGVQDIILATAAGGISKTKDGDIILIKDHINFAPNPLIGRKDQYFFDLIEAYDKIYRNIIKEISIEEKIDIIEGVHAQMLGPSYETPAEINMLKILGADSVSMSLAQDVILSRFFKLNILAFAIISNGAGKSVTHEDVLKNSKKSSIKLKILISKFIENQSNNKKG